MIQSLRLSVLGLLVTVLSYGVLFSLFGKKSRIQPYVRYLLSLVILLEMLSPLIPVLHAVGERLRVPYDSADEYKIQNGHTAYEDTSVAYAKVRCEDSVRSWIAAKTGIAYEAIGVQLLLDAADPSAVVITAAEITLYGRQYRILTDKVAALCEELLCCPCRVSVENVLGEGGEGG